MALSDEACVVDKVDLRSLMLKAVRVEQRMVKGVNLEDEQRRYHILCDRIEFYGHRKLSERADNFVDLGSDYLEVIKNLGKHFQEEVIEARLAADFCPRELVEQHIGRFESLTNRLNLLDGSVQRKINFYRMALKSGWNVIELHVPWSQSRNGLEEEFVDSDELKKSFLALKVADEITEVADRSPFLKLKNQILKVISQVSKGTPAAVSFSDLRHDVIAEVLHDFVFSSGRPMYLPVTYADGSVASPFPIYCVKTRSVEAMKVLRAEPILKVGQMSARHPEMDLEMKVYFFRNQEISIGRSAAEIDKVAYEKAKELFFKMRTEGSFRIGYYQTGFQPTVVGFYRALTEELVFRAKMQPTIEVTPYYFLEGSYKTGKVWC